MRVTLKFILLLCLLYASGCVHVANSIDVENYYNSIIGTQIEPVVHTPKYGWNKINEDDVSYEVEMVKKSGCSYAIKVAKVSNIVLSWRFTSPRKNCDDNYIQLM